MQVHQHHDRTAPCMHVLVEARHAQHHPIHSTSSVIVIVAQAPCHGVRCSSTVPWPAMHATQSRNLKIVSTTHLVAKFCVTRRSVWPVRRRHFCPHQVLGEAAHLVLVFRGKHRVLGLLHLHTAQVAYREKWSRSRSVSSCMLRSGVVGRGALHVPAKHSSCDCMPGSTYAPDWEHTSSIDPGMRRVLRAANAGV